MTDGIQNIPYIVNIGDILTWGHFLFLILPFISNLYMLYPAQMTFLTGVTHLFPFLLLAFFYRWIFQLSGTYFWQRHLTVPRQHHDHCLIHGITLDRVTIYGWFVINKSSIIVISNYLGEILVIKNIYAFSVITGTYIKVNRRTW